MAGGFSFPPPPPPPPKPTVQSQPPNSDYSQQAGRGGRGRGGFESRGRGGSGRGRGGGQGNSNFEPLGQHQRPQFDQGAPTAQPRERFEASISVQPPPGSHINPNFTGQRQDPTANASYEDTPNPRGRKVPDAGQRTPSDTRSNYASSRRLSNDGPGRTQAGHKRKLDALKGPQPPREKKPGLQTAPAVPSFGAPILPPAPSAAAAIRTPVQPQVVNVPNRTQAGPRTLGLTPKGGVEPDYPSESEDEDVDEEAQFAELGTKLTFEHNGEVMTLNNEADLAAWKEERRKQFPTMNRVSQKQEESWRIGEERKRLLAAVSRLHLAPRNRKAEVKTRSLREQPMITEESTVPKPLHAGIANLSEGRSDRHHATASGIQEIEDPPERTSVAPATISTENHSVTTQGVDARSDIDNVASAHEPMSLDQKIEEPRGLPGINMDDTDEESEAEDAVVQDVVAEDAAAEEDVEVAAPVESEAEASSDADSDNDGPPEQVSSKPRPSAASDAQRPVCRYFSASGRCRDGDSCRFRHELSSKAPSARPPQPQPDKPAYDRFAPKLDPKTNDKKSIFERLVEQEEQGDDRLALQVIKALGQAGLFKQPETEV